MVVRDARGERAETDRESHRHELAEVIDREPARLADSATLGDDLALDSLARMNMLAWLSGKGVSIGGASQLPSTVGEVLSRLDAVAGTGVNIRLVDGPGASVGAGAANLHPLRAIPSAGPPLAPVLEDDEIRLSTVEPEDVRFLYALATHPHTCFRWRYRGNPPPIDRFAQDLWSKVLVQFVARRAADGEPVGHVVAYGADMGQGYAYLGAVFQSWYSGTGLAARAVALFVRYLFQTQPLRKLYLEVPGYNWEQVRSGQGRLFQVEGVMRDHEYFAGRYWDRYLCAIYRDGATKLPG
jgi:RimJ/RimL family protein N-acetyltransferase